MHLTFAPCEQTILSTRRVGKHLVKLSKSQEHGRTKKFQWRTLQQLVSEYGSTAGQQTWDALVARGKWRVHPSAPTVRSMEQVHIEIVAEDHAQALNKFEAETEHDVDGELMGDIFAGGLCKLVRVC